MPAIKRKSRHSARVAKAVISFSPGNRLYSEDHFLEALSPFGLSRRGLRSLFASLGVPFLEIGRTRFYDSFTVSIAFHAILRIGQPSFLAPGSSSRRRPPRNTTTSLSPTYLQTHLTAVIAELLACRRLSSDKIAKAAFQRAASEAAHRLLSHGLYHLPAQLQTHRARALHPNLPDDIPSLLPLPSSD